MGYHGNHALSHSEMDLLLGDHNLLPLGGLRWGTHWLMYTSICWYLRVLPVLHRPTVVDIGANTI